MFQQIEAASYTLPMPVPMGSYNESSLLQTSPHMGQNSVSPRPSSSEAESGKMWRFCVVNLPSACYTRGTISRGNGTVMAIVLVILQFCEKVES